jgi:glycosyltransferase involved in cell wall biosynthesis
MKNDSEKTNLPIVKIYSEFPLNYFGGGERLIIMIYHSLKKNGFEVKIIENNRMITESRMEKDNILGHLGNDLLSMSFRRYGFPGFLYQDLPDLMELKSSRNSICLIFSRRLPPKSILSEISKFSGTEFVFCLHGIALEKMRMTDPRIMIHQFIIRHQISAFARFVVGNVYAQCLTPGIEKYLQSKGASQSNIFLIENQYQSGIADLNQNNGSFQVLFIGRMQNLTKGTKFLKKVIAEVKKKEPNIEFVVIGKGPDIHVLDGVKNHCRILTNADDRVKEDNLLHSNLGIITSSLEPASLVAMEFLTSGIPVVTTPSSGPSYILSKDKNFGKISSFNVKAFSKEIISYYRLWRSDKSAYFVLRKNIADKARSTFKEKYMLDSYLKMIIEIGLKQKNK